MANLVLTLEAIQYLKDENITAIDNYILLSNGFKIYLTSDEIENLNDETDAEASVMKYNCNCEVCKPFVD